MNLEFDTIKVKKIKSLKLDDISLLIKEGCTIKLSKLMIDVLFLSVNKKLKKDLNFSDIFDYFLNDNNCIFEVSLLFISTVVLFFLIYYFVYLDKTLEPDCLDSLSIANNSLYNATQCPSAKDFRKYTDNITFPEFSNCMNKESCFDLINDILTKCSDRYIKNICRSKAPYLYLDSSIYSSCKVLVDNYNYYNSKLHSIHNNQDKVFSGLLINLVILFRSLCVVTKLYFKNKNIIYDNNMDQLNFLLKNCIDNNDEFSLILNQLSNIGLMKIRDILIKLKPFNYLLYGNQFWCFSCICYINNILENQSNQSNQSNQPNKLEKIKSFLFYSSDQSKKNYNIKISNNSSDNLESILID